MVSTECKKFLHEAKELFEARTEYLQELLSTHRGKVRSKSFVERTGLKEEPIDYINDVEVRARMSKIEDGIEKVLDDLIKCECGQGQEMKEVTLKIPIEKSDIVESTLKKAGYDVGTDAYYADPDKFVSVIVRPTKELELRSG